VSSPRHIFRSPHAEITVPALSLSALVLDANRARPEDIALADGISGRTITYGELREQVRRVAAGLAALGLRKGGVVALCSPNSPEFAVALHAILCGGATVTPANPANTAEVLEIAADAIEPVPEFGVRIDSRFVCGLGRWRRNSS
jgi:acyl-CoA synthetase (AMP-forming)/AMP-acid ligase II